MEKHGQIIMHVLRPNRNLIEDKLLVNFPNYQDLTRFITGVTVPKLNEELIKYKNT